MRADHEPSPLKCVTQADVDRIYQQICQISSEYERVKASSRKAPTKFAISVLNKMKSASVDKQDEANELIAAATEIYNSQPAKLPNAPTTNPDLWQHEAKQAGKASTHTLISHNKAGMADVRPMTNIDELNAEIEKLRQMPVRNDFQNKKLTLLEKQRKLFEAEHRIVPKEEIDHYSEIAQKYAKLLSLLDREFEKIRQEKSNTVTKIINGKKQEVRQLPELSELIQELNNNPNKHHLLRMISAILKEKYSDDNRHLFTGIMFHDTTGVYNHAAFARRIPFKDLVVPAEYNLDLQVSKTDNRLK